jgi:hypothetical protein
MCIVCCVVPDVCRRCPSKACFVAKFRHLKRIGQNRRI